MSTAVLAPELSLDAQQTALNRRVAPVTAYLVATGWQRDRADGSFLKGQVRIFLHGGNLAIQRHLRLEEVAFSRFIVKTVDSVAQVIEDDLAEDIAETIARIEQAVTAVA